MQICGEPGIFGGATATGKESRGTIGESAPGTEQKGTRKAPGNLRKITAAEPACAMLFDMPTPEQQREYTRLSAQLQSIGQRYFKELPHASVSLVLTVNDGKVLVEAYDRLGKKVGDIPNPTTSSAFLSELESAFAQVTLPDENVIAMVSNPIRLSTT